MKNIIVMLVGLSILTACGAGNAPQIAVTTSSHINQSSEICTMDYQPNQCEASAYNDGSSLASPLSANGGNACNARNNLRQEAASEGLTSAQIQALNISCHSVPSI